MDGTPAIYLGRLVPKAGFRAYVYSADGSKKLINSWDLFQEHMSTGVWFATKADAVLIKVAVEPETIELEVIKPKKSKSKKG